MKHHDDIHLPTLFFVVMLFYTFFRSLRSNESSSQKVMGKHEGYIASKNVSDVTIPFLRKVSFHETSTPRKFNIAPKSRQSQKETHLPTIIFQGLC